MNTWKILSWPGEILKAVLNGYLAIILFGIVIYCLFFFRMARGPSKEVIEDVTEGIH